MRYSTTSALIYLAEALLFYVGAILIARGTYTYLQMVEVRFLFLTSSSLLRSAFCKFILIIVLDLSVLTLPFYSTQGSPSYT